MFDDFSIFDVMGLVGLDPITFVQESMRFLSGFQFRLPHEKSLRLASKTREMIHV